MTCRCTHKGPIFHYTRPRQMWGPYDISGPHCQTTWNPSLLAPFYQSWIYSGRQKALWKSRPVDISQCPVEAARGVQRKEMV